MSNRALAVALSGAAIAILAPLWLPLLFAAWFADLLAPAVRGLESALGGRRRAAAAAVVLLAMGAMIPICATIVVMTSALSDLFVQVRAALEGQGSPLGALLSMVGGASLLGTPGALLGPLLVRLCVESLAIVFETSPTTPA